ncbi:MAG: hypothetical protein MJ252_04640 [archaeon]|nr:hypothetical protein [archaeon]
MSVSKGQTPKRSFAENEQSAYALNNYTPPSKNPTGLNSVSKAVITTTQNSKIRELINDKIFQYYFQMSFNSRNYDEFRSLSDIDKLNFMIDLYFFTMIDLNKEIIFEQKMPYDNDGEVVDKIYLLKNQNSKTKIFNMMENFKMSSIEEENYLQSRYKEIMEKYKYDNYENPDLEEKKDNYINNEHNPLKNSLKKDKRKEDANTIEKDDNHYNTPANQKLKSNNIQNNNLSNKGSNPNSRVNTGANNPQLTHQSNRVNTNNSLNNQKENELRNSRNNTNNNEVEIIHYVNEPNREQLRESGYESPSRLKNKNKSMRNIPDQIEEEVEPKKQMSQPYIMGSKMPSTMALTNRNPSALTKSTFTRSQLIPLVKSMKFDPNKTKPVKMGPLVSGEFYYIDPEEFPEGLITTDKNIYLSKPNSIKETEIRQYVVHTRKNKTPSKGNIPEVVTIQSYKQLSKRKRNPININTPRLQNKNSNFSKTSLSCVNFSDLRSRGNLIKTDNVLLHDALIFDEEISQGENKVLVKSKNWSSMDELIKKIYSDETDEDIYFNKNEINKIGILLLNYITLEQSVDKDTLQIIKKQEENRFKDQVDQEKEVTNLKTVIKKLSEQMNQRLTESEEFLAKMNDD